MIRGKSLGSSLVEAIDFYVRMLSCGVKPNSYTLPFLLKSCAKFAGTHEGKQIHSHVLKLGLESNPFVHASLVNMYAQTGELGCAELVLRKSSLPNVVSFTALITGYASQGCLDDARRTFDEIPVRDTVSWNAMIAGYAQNGRFIEALEFFEEMKKANVAPTETTIVTVLSACAQSGSLELANSIRSWIEDQGLVSSVRLVTALIDLYSKCGELDKARDLFEGISQKDVISWNAMLSGYSHTNDYKEALVLFRKMQQTKIEPTDMTFVSILPACAHLGALDLGKWIHGCINKNFPCSTNLCLWTSLIHMYARCGDIEAAKQVFGGMQNKSLSSWNAMISGLGMHGDACMALEHFRQMRDQGFRPDHITFIGVLSACSHAGLVDLGRQCFNSMVEDYNILPKLHHYGCMIDLLGRAGLFDEAEALVKNMEMKPDGAIWSSLLAACRMHGKVEFGEFAAKCLFELEPENPGPYVLLSNIYADAGRWEDVARIRTKLNDKGMKKVPGCSSIEVDGVVHEFLVGDKVHPHSQDIYMMLDEIDQHLKKAGFVPDTSEVLYDMDEEWKGALGHHSEKLAIAFGLISTKPGTTIRIVKNLRVCRNCHSAIELISKIFNREIIARDRYRFHHFKDGSCSCMAYW